MLHRTMRPAKRGAFVFGFVATFAAALTKRTDLTATTLRRAYLRLTHLILVHRAYPAASGHRSKGGADSQWLIPGSRPSLPSEGLGLPLSACTLDRHSTP